MPDDIDDIPEETPGEGARRRPRGARGALVAAVGAAVIAGSGATPATADPPDPTPTPSQGPGETAAPEVHETREATGVQEASKVPEEPKVVDLPDEVDVLNVVEEPEGPEAAEAADASDEVAARDLERAIAFALRQIGEPYGYGGDGPQRWDCSGLVQQAYRRAGIRLPRVAADQYRATLRIPRSALRRGDLVFWSTNGRASGVHHVAIYVGGGRYIEAARPGTKVRVSDFSFYDAHMYGRPSPVRPKPAKNRPVR
ncbi:C40 family peptidase [Streptomyces sp. NPDC021096]|uniref:C40 family peptidase n=1 Tax=Streptomyces sp. NPDC021096 TaxID=3154792 RepID=UPI0033D1F925